MRRKYGSKSGGSAPQAAEFEFNFGYLYRTIENHIDAFAAQAGDSLALADVADRLGSLLRSKAAQVRQQLGASQLLLEMRQNGTAAGRGAGDRGGSAARPALLGGAPDGGALRPNGQRRKRHLSPQALKKIADAQRKRWAEFHRKHGKKRKPGQTANPSKSMSAFWASKTPEERSAEMKRRRKVAAEKKKAGVTEAA